MQATMRQELIRTAEALYTPQPPEPLAPRAGSGWWIGLALPLGLALWVGRIVLAL